MTTIEERKERQQKLAQKYQYYKDTRSPQEIAVTDRLASLFSEQNLKNLQLSQYDTSVHKNIKKEDILYVCLHGLPVTKNQFAALNLPGQTICIEYSLVERIKDRKQLQSQDLTFENQAKIMDQKINAASTTKPIVLICHSFGTFIMSTYLSLYASKRIIGMIDLVCAPTRIHYLLAELLLIIDSSTSEYLYLNAQKFYKQYTEANGPIFASADYFYGFSKTMKDGNGVSKLHQYIRKWPKVLKCFINGTADILFQESTKNQKFLHYCYANRLQQQYESKLNKLWKKKYGVQCENIQQKFIYIINDAAHSLHLQRKNKPIVQKIINHYLNFLELSYSEEQAKI